jgi:hypothetical protein
MELASTVVSICAACAIPVIFRAMKGRKLGRAGVIKQIGRATVTGISKTRNRIRGHRLHWIGTEELARMAASDPDLVVFCLIDGAREPRQTDLPGQINSTLQQLEETLPWFPTGSRIGIYRVDGIDPALARKLGTLTQGRETFVVSDSLREMEPVGNGRVYEFRVRPDSAA